MYFSANFMFYFIAAVKLTTGFVKDNSYGIAHKASAHKNQGGNLCSAQSSQLDAVGLLFIDDYQKETVICKILGMPIDKPSQKETEKKSPRYKVILFFKKN